jgi:hypothetical protein
VRLEIARDGDPTVDHYQPTLFLVELNGRFAASAKTFDRMPQSYQPLVPF